MILGRWIELGDQADRYLASEMRVLRFSTPDLQIMEATCFSTVLALIPRMVAISELDFPESRKGRVSCSRRVNLV